MPTAGGAYIARFAMCAMTDPRGAPHPWTARAWPPLPAGERGKDEFLSRFCRAEGYGGQPVARLWGWRRGQGRRRGQASRWRCEIAGTGRGRTINGDEKSPLLYRRWGHRRYCTGVSARPVLASIRFGNLGMGCAVPVTAPAPPRPHAETKCCSPSGYAGAGRPQTPP